MRIIITGGTGLIGSRLATNLASDGHEVIVLSRNPDKHSFPAGVIGQEWDSKTAERWGHLADGAEVIINLAGENIAGAGLFPSRWTPERKRHIVESRANAGKAVVEAVRAASNKPLLVMQASGVDYYGDRGDEIITETSSPGTSGFLSQVVPQWEGSTSPVESEGVRRIVMRSGVVFSMADGALPVTVLPFRFFVGGPLGSGRQWMSWIHIEDTVRAIRFLMEQESASGVFNVCAPNPLTYRELARTIGRVLSRPSWIPVPAFVLRLVLGEVADTVLHGRRAIPQRLLEMDFTFRYPDAESALRELI